MGRSGQSQRAEHEKRAQPRDTRVGRTTHLPRRGALGAPVCSLVCEERRRAPRGQQGQGFGRGRRDGVRQSDRRGVSRIAREVRIPGFRPGKAPRRILEARIGSAAARRGGAARGAPRVLRAGRPRARRRRDRAARDRHHRGRARTVRSPFDAVVEVRPRVSVAGYGGLRVEVPRPRPSDEEIDAQVERLRAQFAELEPVERPAIDADHVTIDIVGSRDGEALPGLDADDYLYEVGSAGIVPELDEHLRGAKAGDILEFTAGTPIPTRTRSTSGCSSRRSGEGAARAQRRLGERGVRVRDARRAAGRPRSAAHDRAGDAGADGAARAVRQRRSPSWSTTSCPRRSSTTRCSTGSKTSPCASRPRASDLDQYLAATGTESARVRRRAAHRRPEAVKVDLALRAVADAEDIEVTDDELEEEIGRLAERTQQKPNQLRKVIERNGQIRRYARTCGSARRSSGSSSTSRSSIRGATDRPR